MRPLVIFTLVSTAFLALAGPAFAQEDQPETRIITVTTMEVPAGQAQADFWAVVDKYITPSDKENPHILSERLASHYWGDDRQTVWFITEYESLGHIEQAEDWGNEWFEKHYPEESAERKTADEDFEKHFFSHFANHQDNILRVNLKRVK